MKIPHLLWVALAGGALVWIAARSPSQDYEPLRAETVLDEVPARLSGVVPAGHVVREFDVEGMCCNGCAGKLAGRLDDLDGVSETAVDVKAGRISVVADGALPVDELLGLLNIEKYSARSRP